MKTLFLHLFFILLMCCAGEHLAGQYLELRLIPQEEEASLQVWLRPGLFKNGTGLRLRLENKKKTVLRNKGFILPQDTTSVLVWELVLPPGSYSAQMRAEEPPFTEVSADITIPPAGLPLASSLVLSLKPIDVLDQSPSRIPVFQSSASTLHFALAYQQCPQDQLSVRAILYKAERGNQEPTYASLEQVAAVFRLRDGAAAFRGRFALDSLEAGNYLIEVLAYEDDRIIPELERSQEFSIRWPGLQSLLDTPSHAIKRMQHIAGEQWVAEKMSLDENQQVDALLSFWRRHKPREHELAMARYFQRLATAEALFSQSQTHLCRMYALYGKAEIRRFFEGNSEFQRWHYPKTGITFLFKRRISDGESGLFELVH
jgi:hypothetical protein